MKIANYKLVRLTLAFTWFYHGLIPKLFWQAPQELEMGRRSMQGLINPSHLTIFAGIFEVLLAFSFLVFWKKKFPLYITFFCMVCLTLGIFVFWPQLALQTFNPITLNILIIVLSVVNLNQLNALGKEDEAGN